jgi:hypothetical protein
VAATDVVVIPDVVTRVFWVEDLGSARLGRAGGAMTKCPNGHENADEQQSCGECGEKLVAEDEPAPETSPDAAPVQGGGTGQATVPLSADRARELLQQMSAPEPLPVQLENAAAADDWVSRGRRWLSVRRNQYIAGGAAAALVILIIILAASSGGGSGSAQNVSNSDSGGGTTNTSTPATTTQSDTASGSGATVTATDRDGDKATMTFDVGNPAPASSSSVSSQIQSNCRGPLTGAGLDLNRASVVSVNANVTLTSSQAATVELQMPVDIQSSQPAYFLTQYSSGWQCSEEIAQANISWKTVQPQGSVQQQLWYVIPDAITPNNAGGQGQNILVDPALLLASQPAGLEGSGPRWATCESGFGGSAPPQLIVAGQDTLSNCSTAGGGSGGSSGSTTQTTVPGNGLTGTINNNGQIHFYPTPDTRSPPIATGSLNTVVTIVCSTSGEGVNGSSQWDKVTLDVAMPGAPTARETGYVPDQYVNHNGTIPSC